MGRHGRPDVMGRARSRTFQAAATVGVLGTLAFAYQWVPSNQAANTNADSHSRFDPDTADADDLEYADPASADSVADVGASGDTGSAGADRGSGGPVPSSSAPPRLVHDAGTTETGPSFTANERPTPDSASTVKPSTGRHAKPVSDQPSAPQEEDTGGKPSVEEEQSDPLTSTVDTVGGVVDHVVGGIGGLTGGLTGGLLGG